MNKPFWMVFDSEDYVLLHGRKHSAELAAVDAAEKMALAYPGKRFIVLQTVCALQAHTVANTDLRPD